MSSFRVIYTNDFEQHSINNRSAASDARMSLKGKRESGSFITKPTAYYFLSLMDGYVRNFALGPLGIVYYRRITYYTLMPPL